MKVYCVMSFFEKNYEDYALSCEEILIKIFAKKEKAIEFIKTLDGLKYEKWIPADEVTESLPKRDADGRFIYAVTEKEITGDEYYEGTLRKVLIEDMDGDFIGYHNLYIQEEEVEE